MTNKPHLSIPQASSFNSTVILSNAKFHGCTLAPAADMDIPQHGEAASKPPRFRSFSGYSNEAAAHLSKKKKPPLARAASPTTGLHNVTQMSEYLLHLAIPFTDQDKHR
ncbi:hypothetical protein EAF00_009645 [Botryotinia globosa]|nr:hypothetical protein EAF00_009645 [Botryotinia globosa]